MNQRVHHVWNDKGLQMTRLSTWTTNDPKPKPNWTQQSKDDSDELKIGLNKTETTLMTTIIRMKRCSEVNYCKVMCPCRLNQVLDLEDPEIPYANSTINIQIGLLKTRRRRDCMCRMRRQRIGGHIWPSQVDQPRIDQVLYRMMECQTTLSIMSLNLMIQAMLMRAKNVEE